MTPSTKPFPTPGRESTRLPKGVFARSAALLAGGTAAGQVIVLAAAPLLTRLYTPSDFGLLGIYASLLGILAAIASIRYELAIPLPKRDIDAAALVVLSIAIIPFTSLGIAVALWLFHAPLIELTNSPSLSPHLWALPVGVALWGNYQVLTYWAIRSRSFSAIARTKFTQSLTAVAIQVILFPLGALGLLVGQLASGAAGTTTLFSSAQRNTRAAFSDISLKLVWRMAVQYRRFPQYSAAAGFINTAGTLTPLLLVSAIFEPSVAGQFALVQRILSSPVRLIATSVGQVYLSEGAKLLQSDTRFLLNLFLFTSKRLAAFGVLYGVVLFMCSAPLFHIAFGAEWTLAASMAKSYAIMLAFQIVATPVAQTFNILERQGLQLAWDCLRLGLVCLSFLYARQYELPAERAVAVYVTAMCATYTLLWTTQLGLLTRMAFREAANNDPNRVS